VATLAVRTTRGSWLASSCKALVVTFVVVLAAVGIASGLARGFFVQDLVARVDPHRTRAFAIARIHDPFADNRHELVQQVDGRFAANPSRTRLHVLTGAVFLLFAPLQLSRRIRVRWPDYHRWSGRLLVVMALVSAIPGFYFGLAVPFAGNGERVPIALFGALFVFAIVRAWVAIRRKNVLLHREWMIRAVALALAVSTVRLLALMLDALLTPRAFSPHAIFVLSLWAGWGLTLGAAELWLRHTRRARLSFRPEYRNAARAS
jgi:hypothetical protein